MRPIVAGLWALLFCAAMPLEAPAAPGTSPLSEGVRVAKKAKKTKKRAKKKASKKGEEKKPSLRELTDFIFSKMEYDLSYFTTIQRLKERGKSYKKLSKKEFDKESRRAKVNLPVLQRFDKEKARYAKGKPFSVPTSQRVHRVYANLIAIVNMAQADAAGDYSSMRRYGGKIKLDDKESLGQVRGEGTDYYVALYREFFYMMAAANYRLGRDSEAVQWMARIEADTDLANLKKKIEKEGGKKAERDPAAIRAERLEVLRSRPVAMVSLQRLDTKDEENAWMGDGFAEVLTADLIQHTDLVVAERSQVAGVLNETALSQLGLTDPKNAKALGMKLKASSLVGGTFQVDGDKVNSTMHLVDAETGERMAQVSGTLRKAELFRDARAQLMELLISVEWLDATDEATVLSAHAPRADTVRDLMKARLLKATKSSEAKALYAKAIREDPRYASLFGDLKTEFDDVSSTLAVMPFVNVSGNDADVWMVGGVRESLTADLPKMNFTVVERAQLAELLRQQELGQLLGTDDAQNIGQKVGADFVVMGSILHQGPVTRIDTRFVDVRTGIILFSTSVEDRNDDFMGLLVTLSKEIAEHFNQQLSNESIDELVARKQSKEDFEKYVRQQLAKESLAANVTPVDANIKEEPSRIPFWTAVGGAAAGGVLALVGFTQAAEAAGDRDAQNALAQQALRQEDKDRFESERDDFDSQSKLMTGLGAAGIGLTVAAAAYIVYDELSRASDSEKTLEIEARPGEGAQGEDGSGAGVTPLLGPAPGGAMIGLSAEF